MAAIDQPEPLPPAPPPGALEPLREPTFRTIWIANLVSNVGGWMQTVAVSWEMTHLASSPLFVALVATASVLPVFFFAYPAGVLADQFDRRKYLIVCQLWMMLSAALLAVLAYTGDLSAWNLLLLTFALGIGNAVNGPAWQSAVPELVGRRLLPPAVALNSAGFNVARTVGPGIGGLIYAFAGAVTLFALNALSFLAVVLALLRWQRAPVEQGPRGFLAGVISGAVYLRQAPDIHIILLRSILFFLPAAALGALLPLLARDHLALDATGLGVLMSAFGGGAVLGAFVLPRLRGRFGDEGAVLAAMLIYAIGLGLVMLPIPLVSGLGVGLAGVGWIGVISSNNVAAQLRLPAWVRARGIAVYQMSFFGSLAVGSVIWGKVAEFIGPVWTIGAALGLLLLFTALVSRLRKLDEPASEA
ncbi:MAG: putative transrane transport protein [Alphaproteobacteria bacterium]|nr:putative transrane transport protein [Alphaproteobacteria bacterium]